MAQKRTPAPPPDPEIPSLRTSQQEARAKLEQRISVGEAMLKEWHLPGKVLVDDDYQRQKNAWDEHNKTLLLSIFDGTLFLDQYKRQGISVGMINVMHDPTAMLRACSSTVTDKISRLRSICDQIDLCPAPAVAVTEEKSQGGRDRLLQICRRFPAFARQLQKRHAQRQPFVITDEYDVQDLMHALLRLDFDDIRPEEWTPRYAGKNARMDFVLKRERLVLEIKMTRDGLGVRELGDQLIVDIERYKEYSDCETLVCFVYDPDHRIGNPAELESDLGASRVSPQVCVVVAPRD